LDGKALAEQRKKEAEASASLARAAQLEAEASSKLLLNALNSPFPTQKGRDVTVLQVLDQAVRELRADTTLSLQRRASLLHTLGSTLYAHSRYATGVDTRVFVIDSSTPVFDAGALRVVATANLNGQTTEKGLKPFTVRIGAPEAVALGGAKLSINGAVFDLEEFQDGEHTFLYPVDSAYPGEPRQFLAATGPVPAHLSIPGYASTGETQTLDFRFLCLGQETTIATVQAEPGEEAFGSPAPPPPPPPSGGSGWQEPGDEVTMTDLLLAFRLLYGDAGQDLLYYFQQGGGVIQLGDVLGDLDVDVWNFGAGTYIQIENDDAEVAGTKYHPGVAAQLLWNGLNECLAYHHIRVNIPVTDLNALIASRQAVSLQACQTGIAAAELYLSGIGVASDGVDLVLTINELSEGNYTAIAGALPFIPVSLLGSSGRVLFNNVSGQTLDVIDSANALVALQSIKRGRWQTSLGGVLDEYSWGETIRRVLTSGSGPVNPPTWRGELAYYMKKLVPKPGNNFRAHHDLIWAERVWFAKHGIDVTTSPLGAGRTMLHITAGTIR
jgi:hypothetical protein